VPVVSCHVFSAHILRLLLQPRRRDILLRRKFVRGRCVPRRANLPTNGLPALWRITTVSSVTAPATKRVFNFNAGPAALPLTVLERIGEELLDWRGTGMSVMEMSHRSPEFESINAAAEAGLRKHLAIPEDYAVIFVQGGGSMQFTMVPMN